MRLHPDDAFKSYLDLIKNEWIKLTESDTRSKIIDPLFKTCLNWQESDIIREEYSKDGAFIDYVFKLNDKNVFIVEAKKEGISFEIPVTFGRNRRYKLNHVISTDKNIKDAIIQAQDYCIKKGVRYGVITNGSQFIIFEAYKIGEEWTKCNSVVFYNFDDIKNNFVDFWNVLSKDAVEKNSLIDNISKDIEELTFYKVIDGIRYKNIIQPRNRLYRYFYPIIKYAFEEITDDDKVDLMRQCYIIDREYSELNETLKKYLIEIKLTDTLDYDFKQIITTEDTAQPFQLDFYKYTLMVNEDKTNPIVFLILGGTGSGKTTFIHRFFKFVLSEKEQENLLWFYVNFRDAPIEEKQIRNFIIENVFKELFSKYKKIYDDLNNEYNLDIIDLSIDKLSIIFTILKSKGYSISLIIDNVDQHKSSSPNFHENIFIESNNITKKLKILTIITLREESFYSSSIQGVFDAYYTEGYEITPPDFRKLILTRLDYVLRKLNEPVNDIKKLMNISINIEKRFKDIKPFLQIVRDSIYKTDRRGISLFISKTAGSNMRRALELFSQFLISGNTKIDEILGYYRKHGSYQIAYHQFIKSIILGNYRYFSEDTSYLLNIFDFNVEHYDNQFLKLKILSYAEDNLFNDSPAGRGFISINNLIIEGEKIKISPEAIRDALFKLSRYGLIILDNRSRETLEGASYFKITDSGSYYIHVLIRRFPYLDLVWVDTPISDIDLVRYLRSLLEETDLNIRFERTRQFIDYLSHMEERQFQLYPELKGSKLGKYVYVKNMTKSFEKQKSYILRKTHDREEQI